VGAQPMKNPLNMIITDIFIPYQLLNFVGLTLRNNLNTLRIRVLHSQVQGLLDLLIHVCLDTLPLFWSDTGTLDGHRIAPLAQVGNFLSRAGIVPLGMRTEAMGMQY
jgi:hypothetical protein